MRVVPRAVMIVPPGMPSPDLRFNDYVHLSVENFEYERSKSLPDFLWRVFLHQCLFFNVCRCFLLITNVSNKG